MNGYNHERVCCESGYFSRSGLKKVGSGFGTDWVPQFVVIKLKKYLVKSLKLAIKKER